MDSEKSRHLVRDFQNKYIIEHDAPAILKMLAADIHWIGTGENSMAQGIEQVSQILRRETSEMPVQIKMSVVSSDVVELHENLLFIHEKLNIKNRLDENFLDERCMRMSVLCEEKDGETKIRDVHISFPEKGGTLEDQLFQELSLSLERHKIIMEQSTDIIFEYDKKTKRMQFSDNWEKKFGYEPMAEKTFEIMIRDKYIYERDVTTLMQLIREIRRDASYAECEIRIMKSDGDYIWCKIRATLQKDESGEAKKVVGVILDIDSEKKKTQNLVDRAEKDALTGIYNKGASEKHAKNYLAEMNDDEKGAVLIIDIDNFKQVNDIFGHLKGDMFLTESAKVFRDVFRRDDIVGRIGGDEFLVVMKGIPNRQVVTVKAKEILTRFSRLAVENKYKVSCSIGIAIVPEHGRDFKELYDHADTALYHVKENGKNSYAIYS